MNTISISGGLLSSILDMTSLVKASVEIDFKRDGTWVALPDAYVGRITVDEKLENDTGKAVANTFSVELNNKHHWFSDKRFGAYSADFASPGTVNLNGTDQGDGYGYLRAGTPVRVKVTVGPGNEWITRCTGYVDTNGFRELIGRGFENGVTINCWDRAKEMIDDPMEDAAGNAVAFAGVKISDPDDFQNSLVHQIAAFYELAVYLGNAAVAGTTVTVGSTAKMKVGMEVKFTSSIRKVLAITSGTQFTIEGGANIDGLHVGAHASFVRAEKVPIVIDTVTTGENGWKELSLLADAALAHLTFDEENFLRFEDSIYKPGYVQDTTPKFVFSNSVMEAGIEKSPDFSLVKNAITVSFKKTEWMAKQTIIRFMQNYNKSTNRCAFPIKASLSGVSLAHAALNEVKLPSSLHQATDGFYSGWEITIDSETREIVGYTASTDVVKVSKAFTVNPGGKALKLKEYNPVTSEITDLSIQYALEQEVQVGRSEEDSGRPEVATARNIDSVLTVEYIQNGVTYTAFDPARLSCEVFAPSTVGNKCKIRLKNNATQDIILTRLEAQGEPLCFTADFSYTHKGESANKSSSKYIGVKKEEVSNKYLTDEIVYDTKHYIHFAHLYLDVKKSARRTFSISSKRPLIHLRPGVVAAISETLQGTAVSVTAVIQGMSLSILKGRAECSFTLREVGDYPLQVSDPNVPAVSPALAPVPGASPAIITQYSVDGSTGWHTDYASGDRYMRSSNDAGATFGASIRIVGEDGITIEIDNSSKTVPAEADGSNPVLMGTGCTIRALLGNEQLPIDNSSPYGNKTFRVSVLSAVGITAGALTQVDGQNAVVVGDHTNMTADVGTITYQVTLKNAVGVEVSISRVQTIVKARKGIAGESGDTRNLLDTKWWDQGRAAAPSGWSWSETDASENVFERGIDPFGRTSALLKNVSNVASPNNADGGWSSNLIEVDPTKPYRFVAYMMRKELSDGTSYFGLQTNLGVVQSLAGVDNNNPYFWSGDLPVVDRWYCLVGYVLPSDTNLSAFNGAIYDCSSGQRVRNSDGSFPTVTGFKWKIGTLTARHRQFFFYTASAGRIQYNWNPRIELLDGNELPIEALLMPFNLASMIAEMGDDTLVTPSEKLQLVSRWCEIYNDSANPSSLTDTPDGEYKRLKAEVVAEGLLGDSYWTNYAAAVEGLRAYLYTNPAILGSSLWNSSVRIVKADFLNAWNLVAARSADLQTRIARKKASNAEAAANGAVVGIVNGSGAVDVTAFASGVRPIRIVGTLPANPYTGYVVGDIVTLTTDGCSYRLLNAGAAGTSGWSKSVATADLSGQLLLDQMKIKKHYIL